MRFICAAECVVHICEKMKDGNVHNYSLTIFVAAKSNAQKCIFHNKI
jgi:hypothetical protein